jgi:hypothetical protein
MATLPGLPFYRSRGFVADEAITLDLGGVSVTFVPMERAINPALAPARMNVTKMQHRRI